MGFLLIDIFKKHFNPQNDGHLDLFRVAVYIYRGKRKPISSHLNYVSYN